MTRHGKFHGSPDTTRETRLTKWVEAAEREKESGNDAVGRGGEQL